MRKKSTATQLGKVKRKSSSTAKTRPASTNTRRVAPDKSLAICRPDLARQWAQELNGKLTPSDVSVGSRKKVWWRCRRNRDHNWPATIYNRTKPNGTDCPFCAKSHGSPSKKNNLVARCPDVALEWHPRKNRPLTPYDVRPGSSREVWWQCQNDGEHVWLSTVAHRAIRGDGCPFCSGKRVSKTNSFAAVHPELVPEWHPTKNGTLLPTGVTQRSRVRVWWTCKKCRRDWEAAVVNRARGKGCPFCAHKRVSSDNSLSALQPGLAAEFHRTLNGDLTPDTIAAQSKKVVWWQCPMDRSHVWQCRVDSRTNDWRECPDCKGASPNATSPAVSKTNNIAAKNPLLAKLFDLEKNAPFTPADFAWGSDKSVWWRCPNGPDHSWQACPVNIRWSKTGGCPFCIGKRASVTNSLVILRPDLVAEWHPTKNGDVDIQTVVVGSHHRVWWQCAQKHDWQAIVRDRVRGYGKCRLCKYGHR